MRVKTDLVDGGLPARALHGPQAELLVFNLRRENVKVASVRYDSLDPSLGYVRISQFNDNTASELTYTVQVVPVND